MARGLILASSEYFGPSSSVPFTAPPFSVSARVYPTASPGTAIWSLADTGTTNNFFYFFLDSSDQLYFRTRNTSDVNINTTNTISLNTWHNVCVSVVSTSSRSCWLDADDANKGSNVSTPKVPSGIDRWCIGANCKGTGSPVGFSDMYIAELAMWDAALTLPDVQALNAGVAPPLIRPSSLRRYVPMMSGTGGAVDIWEGDSLAENGTITEEDHPRMIYPSRQLQLGVPAAAGRITKNTRSHPLGQNIGMAHRMVG